MPVKTLRHALILILLLISPLYSVAPAVAAENIVPPEDPRQSIVYWQPYVVDPRQDAGAAEAERIFRVLLRGWDSARLEPSLHVVASTAGPWAASLADGNILLSRAAIETCQRFGKDKSQHLLAFVLAHELAHQRADDLWHQKFFRLAGTQGAAVQAQLVDGMQTDELGELARKEARADHDALVLMTSVGFDPYRVVDKRDFFTQWVESIWKGSCADSATNQRACREAQTRALRARVQLERVATQATLYELGTQAFVAGNFTEARRYFTAFGREYPSRAVLSSIGTTYLAEALQEFEQLRAAGRIKRPDFFYPLYLDASPKATPRNEPQGVTRGAEDERLPASTLQLLAEANSYFERALRLEPQHRQTYLLLAVSHLLEGNPYLVRGVMQGRYAPRFGADPALALLLAMTTAIEGELAAAATQMDAAVKALGAGQFPSELPEDLFTYAAYHNAATLAELRNNSTHAQRYWSQLATVARSRGESLLFRLAVEQLTPSSVAGVGQGQPYDVAGLRPGDRVPESLRQPGGKGVDVLWMNGTPLSLLRFDGARIASDDDGVVRHAWRVSPARNVPREVAVGDPADRALKVFGKPSRRVYVLSGQYLAYDALGVALRIDNGQVASWFLYTTL